MSARPFSYVFKSILILCAVFFIVPTAWARSPLDGTLTIRNARIESIRVSIDGKPVGFIKAQSSRTFDAVPNGVRFLKVKAQTTSMSTHQVVVPVRGAGHFEVPAIRGEARIHNGTGMRMRVSVNGRYAGTVAAGADLPLRPLAEGQHRIVAYPTNPLKAYLGRIDKKVRIRAGQTHRIELSTLVGHLQVKNPFSHRVALRVNGKRMTRLGAYESFRIANLSAGDYKVELRRRGRTLASDTIVVKRGKTMAWRPELESTGTLKIANRSYRSVTIASPSFGRRTVGAGETLRLTVSAGEHTLRVHGRFKAQFRTVDVEASATTKLVVRRHGRRHASKYAVEELYAHH